MEALCFALLESMLAYILWIRYTLKLEALCLQQYKEIIRKVRVGEKMKQNIKVKPHPMALLLFILYILLLFYLLFFSETYGRTMDSGYRYNLELFKEIRRFWENRDSLGWQNVIINLLGNIVAFAPFGFFLPMLCRMGRNLFGCVLLSALFSLAVETVQLFTKVGAFDVDDIFLNALGGLAGFLCYYLVWKPLGNRK